MLILAAGLAGCTSAPVRPAATATPSFSPAVSPATAIPSVSVSSPQTAAQEPAQTPATPGASPAGWRGTPRGQAAPAGSVDRSDATAVAVWFAGALMTYDTALDVSPSDAGRRAAALASPSYAASLTSAPDLQPGYWWTTLQARHGWTSAATRLGGIGQAPADTATTAYRAVSVTATGRDQTGWSGDVQGPYLLLVTCTRAAADQPWTVASAPVSS